MKARVGLGVLFAGALGACQPVVDHPFDVVLVGGRVIDPESGLDAVRNVP